MPSSLTLLLLLLAAASTRANTVRLNDSSHIRGFNQTVSGRPIWHYLGIPYAKPPVGPLRFRAPQPPDGPIGGTLAAPLDVLHKPRSCYYWPLAPSEYEKVNSALMMWWNNTEMSEDCLYLNVWTPTVSTEDKKAVMVWIFGGGFYGGSASLEVYDGAVLSSKGDVIVASMQYRTGALGFMHLDDDESPGNMGLMDQQMALKWLWTNINKFGGDPTRITLFGESAGGVSVSYHMLSPGSKAYFSRGIMNSGTALAWWGYESRAQARAKAEHLARQVGCSVDPANHRLAINCMRNVSPTMVQEKTTNTYSWMNEARTAEFNKLWNTIKGAPFMFFDVTFKPVYGTNFIPERPDLAMHNGNIKNGDILLGNVKDEGTFWIMYALYDVMLRNNSWYLPHAWNNPVPMAGVVAEDPFERLPLSFLPTQYLHSLQADALAFEYQVPSKRFGFSSWRAEDVINAFDDLTGDRSFKCPSVEFADMYLNVLEKNATQSHKVWYYSLEHQTEKLPLPKWTGVMHGYELDYVFGNPFNGKFTNKFYNFTSSEELLSDDVIRFWTNFAKTGDPNMLNNTVGNSINRAWPQYRTDNRSSIVLETRPSMSYRTVENFRRRECSLWRYQLAQIRDYIRKNEVPCPTQPTEGTVMRAGTRLQSPAGLVVVAALAAAASVRFASLWGHTAR